MNEERKKPVWPWIVVAFIATLILYPLSEGPAWWVSWKFGGHPQVQMFLLNVDGPSHWARQRMPIPVAHWLGNYELWWVKGVGGEDSP